VKLLQAAAGFVGGEKQLALPLGLVQPLLDKPMAALGRGHVLAHHQSLIALAVARRSGLGGDSAVVQ
jgi:hypothetical protein